MKEGSLTPAELEEFKKVRGRRNFLRSGALALIGLGLIGEPLYKSIESVLTGKPFQASVGPIACSRSDTTKPATQYEHALSVTGSYLYGGAAAGGTVEVTMKSTGQKYTGTIGQAITLAKTTSQTELCDILIKADGAHPREYTQVNVTNTNVNTKLAESAKLDVGNLLNEVMFGGKNASWTPHNINVIFNPDPDSGQRLDQGYINQIVSAINNIKAWSGGYIQSVNFDFNGNKVYAGAPPEGEVWVFRESNFSGATNGTFPSGGAKVTSSGIFINQSSADSLMAYNETFDAFIQGEQNVGEGKSEWWLFMMNRPRDTNSYVLSLEKETQVGVDNLTQVNNYAQTMIRNIPDPTNPMGGIMGQRDYNSIESTHPTKDNPLRPGTEQRIREKY
jgi:hypothetical protein